MGKTKKPVVEVTTVKNRIPPITCPNCLAANDGITSVHPEGSEFRMPVPGDPIVCAYCGSLNVLVTGTLARRATPEEKSRWSQDLPLAGFLAKAMTKRNVQ